MMRIFCILRYQNRRRYGKVYDGYRFIIKWTLICKKRKKLTIGAAV